MSENRQRLKAKRESAAMDGRLKAWTGQECKGEAVGREQRLKAVGWSRVRATSFLTATSSDATRRRGSCPSTACGNPNPSAARGTHTSRPIITHVLVFMVLRRMSSVTLVYVFPSLLRLSASCCPYVNPFPLPLGAWTTPWNQSAARGVSSATRGSGYINVSMKVTSRKPTGLKPHKESKGLKPPCNVESK